MNDRLESFLDAHSSTSNESKKEKSFLMVKEESPECNIFPSTTEKNPKIGGKRKNPASDGLNITEIGSMALQSSPEQLPALLKSVVDATRGSLQFDFSDLRKLSEIGTPGEKLVASSLAGMLILLQAERTRAKKAKASDNECKKDPKYQSASFDPFAFSQKEPVFVTSPESGELIDAVHHLFMLPPLRSTLLLIVQNLCNKWFEKFLPNKEDRTKYTTSLIPRAGHITIPSSMINTPIGLLTGAVKLTEDGCAGEAIVAETISVLWRQHATYLLNQAREDLKKHQRLQKSSN